MKRNLWPLLPVGLLLMMAVTQGILITSASGGDPVETDYYRKAVAWDAHMEQEETNRSLGWRLQLKASPARAGTFSLDASVHDAAGQPITDAQVTVEAFPNAHSDQRLSFELTPSAGRYQAELPVGVYGLWEFRFVVERKPAVGEVQRLTWTERQDLNGPSSLLKLPRGYSMHTGGSARR